MKGMLGVTTIIVVLAAASVLANGDDTKIVKSALFREVPVAFMPEGDDPSGVAAEPCEDCEEGYCSLGFLMVDERTGSLWFYDYWFDNIKLLVDRDASGQQKTYPGAPVEPDDGIILEDGSILVVVDHWRTLTMDRRRFGLYRLSTDSNGEWALVDSLEADQFGVPDADQPRRVLTFAKDGQENTYLTAGSGFGILIAQGVDLVDSGERQAVVTTNLTTGARSSGLLGSVVVHSPDRDVRDIILTPETLIYRIGTDREGNTYSHHPGRLATICKLSPSGHLIWAARIPRTKITKSFAGRGDVFVLKDGTIWRVLEQAGGLNVSQLVPPSQ